MSTRIRPAAATDAIAAVHVRSWRHAYHGILPATYLDPRPSAAGPDRRLLTGARERLLHLGFGTATLWVLEASAGARRFYEADGWVVDGAIRREVIGGLPVTELRYARPLA
jgi:hypothetical protein